MSDVECVEVLPMPAVMVMLMEVLPMPAVIGEGCL